MLLSAFEVSQCMLALLEVGLEEKCEGATANAKEVGVEKWLLVQFGMACLNFIFAPYIQFRLWQNLQQEAAAIDQKAGPLVQQFVSPDSFVDVPRAKIKAAFWNVFLYDLGVCFYVFALVGSGVWSHLGSDWFGGQSLCDPDGLLTTAALTGLGYVIFVAVYFLGFTCYMNCVTTLEVNPPAKQAMMAAGYALAAQHAAAHGMPVHAVPGSQQGRPARGGLPQKKSSWQKPVLGAVVGQAPTSPVAGTPVVAKATRTPMERALHPSMMLKGLACIGLDLMGDASYLLPGLGEELDLAYAPAQAIALKMMFRYTALPALGFTEEILPGTDIMPSATFGWLLEVFAPDNSFTRAIGIRSDASP